MGVVYYIWRLFVSRLLLVAESIRCLGQETEHYEVCSPKFNFKNKLYLC